MSDVKLDLAPTKATRTRPRVLLRRVPLPNGETMLVVDQAAFRAGVEAAERVLKEDWEASQNVRRQAARATIK